jgi:predicted  nucleic acid-binding Zn-ribbon protein
MNKDKEIADNLASHIAESSANIAMLRDSISNIRYAIARLRTNAENDLALMTDMEYAIAKLRAEVEK